jgi:hypothetical protein
MSRLPLLIQLSHLLLAILSVIVGIAILSGGFKDQILQLGFPPYLALVGGGVVLLKGILLFFPLPTLHSTLRGSLAGLSLLLAMSYVAAGFSVWASFPAGLFFGLAWIANVEIRRY